jgi:hypothetical protein
MFPELAHRMVLDGVSNAMTFTNDIYQHAYVGTEDTNKVWQGFFASCAEAGPDGCALAAANSTAKEIEQRITALSHKLIAKPLPVPFTGLNSGIVTASDINTGVGTAAHSVQYWLTLIQIFLSMYKPALWPKFAKALAAAEAGEWGALADLVGFSDIDMMTRPKSMTNNVFNRHMETMSGGMVASTVSWFNIGALRC